MSFLQISTNQAIIQVILFIHSGHYNNILTLLYNPTTNIFHFCTKNNNFCRFFSRACAKWVFFLHTFKAMASQFLMQNRVVPMLSFKVCVDTTLHKYYNIQGLHVNSDLRQDSITWMFSITAILDLAEEKFTPVFFSCNFNKWSWILIKSIQYNAWMNEDWVDINLCF